MPAPILSFPDGEAIAYLSAPFGSVRIFARQGRLTGIDVLAEQAPGAAVGQPENEVQAAIARQLMAYFENPETPFDVPLEPMGTAFQKSVWLAIARIPPGQTATYASLAVQVRSGPRAVAAACKANPFPLVIPCHRVVASQGLGGYCGQRDGPMLEIKRWLLRHEGYQPEFCG